MGREGCMTARSGQAGAHLWAAACPICRRAGPARARLQSCGTTATRRSAASAARARPGESVAQPRVTRPHLERRRGHKEPPAARHGLRHLELATQEWALNLHMKAKANQCMHSRQRGATQCSSLPMYMNCFACLFVHSLHSCHPRFSLIGRTLPLVLGVSMPAFMHATCSCIAPAGCCACAESRMHSRMCDLSMTPSACVLLSAYWHMALLRNPPNPQGR